MANRVMKAYFETGNHEVGVINTSWAKPIVNGAILTTADIDNYLLVEFDGYNSEGVRQCKPLTDTTKKGLLVSTSEEEGLFGDGTSLQGNYTDFYNEVGEIVNLTVQEEYLRFETSAFTLNAGLSSATYGHVAHYDKVTKKYIISDPASAHADYATAGNKYEVVGINTDFGFNVGKTCIRLECK